MTRRIISASRRTDIPAVYWRWFVNRLQEGFCHHVHPFSGQLYRVSLRPEDCLGIVFWTRNPGPMLKHIDWLLARGYPFYVLVTLTAYPRELESHGPAMPTVVRAIHDLARRLSSDLVFWRYDPIILSNRTPAAYHIQQFDRLSSDLAGSVGRCIVSFVDLYGKTRRNLGRLAATGGWVFEDPALDRRRELVLALADLARKRGMTLHACCEEPLVGERVTRAHCVDPEVIQGFHPGAPLGLQFKPTRPGCGCVQSVDIGAYDTCPLGCLYCYATTSRQAAMKRRARHDPTDSLLWRPEPLQGVDLSRLERSLDEPRSG